MTAQEMSDKIVARISGDRRGVGVSVCELLDHCGQDARGELTLELQPNLVLWSRVSDVFGDAFKLALSRIDMQVLPPILVLTEPRLLDLPIAKGIRPYKAPRWLPVALFAKKQGAGA